MAQDLERLVVQLDANIRGFRREMEKAQGITNRQARAVERRAREMNRNLSNIGRQAAQSLIAPLAGIGAALGTREIMAYADAWTRAGNLINAAAAAAGVQTRSLSELRQGADEARTSFESYTELYARLIRAASGVAKSEEEIALATNLVSKAMVAGGASTQEQASAILQLGQALSAGVLQGEELASLRENAPIIAQAIADEFETTIGGLRDLGAEGKLTADRVFRAILSAQSNIESQFSQTNRTISDGFTALRNAVIEYIGTAAEASGVTNAINGVLSALAGNLNSVAAAAAAAAVVLLNQFALSITRAAAAQAVLVATNPFLAIAAAAGTAAFAIGAFGDQITPIEGDLANLHDYAGAIWDGIKEDAATSWQQIKDSFLGVINMMTGAMGGVEVTWADVVGGVVTATNKIIGALLTARDIVIAAFTRLPAAIAEKAVDAMNGMIRAIEEGLNKVSEQFNKVINGINGLPIVAKAAISPLLLLGDISPIPPVDLNEVENTYRGAGEAAAGAFADATKHMERDFIKEVGEGLRDAANDRAFIRTIEAAIDRTGTSGTGSTEGYGGGTGIPAPGSGTGSGSGGKGRGSRERANELEREIQQIRERTEALRAETEVQAGLNPLLNDYEYAITKARASQELLVAAQRAGVQVTPEVRANIERLSEAYAQATVESNRLAEAQGKIRERADEMAALRQDVTGGFISDLRRGTSAADALSSALGKIADKLIDIGQNNLFGPGSQAYASGGRGLFGGAIIPGILHDGGTAGVDGYGHGRSFPASTWAGARRMHSGGVVGGLMPNEVPTILKRGERVSPEGQAGGGVLAITVNVQGARGNAEIEEMVSRGVRQGLGAYDQSLPARVRAIRGDERFMG